MPIAHLKSIDAVVSVTPPPDPLEKPVHLYRVTKLPIEAAFESVSRSYGVTVVFDPGLKGEVTLELQDGIPAEARQLIGCLASVEFVEIAALALGGLYGLNPCPERIRQGFANGIEEADFDGEIPPQAHDFGKFGAGEGRRDHKSR